MLSIEVWKPKITIPKSLKEDVKSVKPIQLRKYEGVMPVVIGNIRALLTDGICEWHDDKQMDKAHTILYIIRNDHNSYVQCRGHKTVYDQSVGTFIYLNIHKTHRLWHKEGNDLPFGVWCAVCVDLDDPPESREFCEKMIKKAIKLNLPVPDSLALSV